MAFQTFTVPIRGKIKRIHEDGHPIADTGGVRPVDLLDILRGNPATAIPPTVFVDIISYDWDSGTAIVRLTTDDAAWLAAAETYLAGIQNLLAAELAVMQSDEVIMEAPERSRSEGERTEFAKGLQITRADVTRWKVAKGR